MSRIVEAFEKVCAQHPERAAMVHLVKGKPVTTGFSQLATDTAQARAFLSKSGVKRGDRLLAFANSGYRLCVFLIACFELGACVMYVDIHAGQENLKRIFEKTNPKFVLVSDKTRHFRVLFREIHKIKSVINIDRAQSSGAYVLPPPETSESDDALITVTTGSTGTPKLFIRTHRDLFEQLRLVTDNIGEKDSEQTVLTTSYIYIFFFFLLGFTTVLPNVDLGSKKADKIIRRLKSFDLSEVTMIITTPDFCLRTPNMYPKLKTLYCGGAILNRSEVKRIQSAYPCKVIHIYGSTECNLISSVDLGEYLSTLEQTGECLLGDICRGVEAKTGENGHILVNSAALLTKSADGEAQHGEYYDTNDVGYIKDGKLFYRGKAGFCLNSAGKTVYSNELEQRLILSFPEIGKCAAVEHERRFYLFLEDKALPRAEISAYLQREYGVAFFIKNLRAIPRDVKHHTKINYLDLMHRLEQSH